MTDTPHSSQPIPGDANGLPPNSGSPPVGAADEPRAYDENSIKVLHGLDPVRKRPGMYIGDTDDGSGLHHMIYEVVDNAIDEALEGYCDTVTVTLNADGSCTVTDNGRGIPVGIHEEEGVSAAEVIMTQLHAGGKFDQNSYKVSGGLHGVGVSVVNALSSRLDLRIFRNGAEWFMRFHDGVPEAPLAELGPAPAWPEGSSREGVATGTEISCLPSTATVTKTEFDFTTLEHRLRELAFLNSGVTLVLTDLREAEPKTARFHYDGGLEAFVQYLDRSKQSLHAPPLVIRGEREGIIIEIAMEWTDSYHETMLCFTNNIPQRDGGTHLAGFRGALTRTVNAYANDSGLAKKEKVALTGEDMRDRRFQAILPLKGKILNVERARFDKMLSSAEIGTLIQALGTGIGSEDFAAEKARYHRIIIMTDADVDGSHIRTLLLTFFFRQMRGLIERGFLYIAQPPLYRLQRGNAKPVYLKDDPALEAFLFDAALRDAVFTQHDGGQRAGNDLRDLLEQARVQRRWVQPLVGKVGNIDVVEQAAIAGALAAGILADPNRAIEMAHRTADRLNALDEPGSPDGVWRGEVIAGEGLVFRRNRQGVEERRLIDAALLRSSEARRLDGDGAVLREIYERAGRLVARDKEYRIVGPAGLVEAIMELGRRGIEINRYKGLGEMNPDQLWETTLDPERRSLF